MANETIIQAAGQRYAPIKIDYSGYIQGLAHIATALIEKRKAIAKKEQSINDEIYKGVKDIDFTPYKNFIKSELGSGKYSQEQTMKILENLNLDKEKHKELVELRSTLATSGVSSGENAIFENWVNSYTLKDFDKTIKIKHVGGIELLDEEDNLVIEEIEVKLDYIIDPNDFRVKVLDFDGDGYIDIDQALERIQNSTSKTDGVVVKNILTDFYSQDLGDEDKFSRKRLEAKTNLKSLFELGSLSNKGEVVIPASRIKLSAMIDQTYQLRTDEEGLVFGQSGFRGSRGTKEVDITFYDWYLHNNKMPDDACNKAYY